MENSKEKVALFKSKTHIYLQRCAIEELRELGRKVGLQKPTTLCKEVLIDTIIQTLCGELPPARTTKGKPPKPHFLDPKIFIDIETIKKECGIEYSMYYDNPPIPQEPKLPVKAAENPVPQEPELPIETAENPIPPMQIIINFSELSLEQKKKLRAFLHCL
ncbi:MAG: hypothetical protein J6D30_05745 [Clostridia bacterium]|nr:hypothetical protein [Clostridia bacterium]